MLRDDVNELGELVVCCGEFVNWLFFESGFGHGQLLFLLLLLLLE